MKLENASTLAPVKCMDCGAKLAKPVHGRYFPELGYRWMNVQWHIPCVCGVTYVWSWDETYKNGGVWKRRSSMPLFEDKARCDNFGKTRKQKEANDGV